MRQRSRAHDDVHAVTAQPRSLVEAVLRPARQPDLADHVEDRSLRRRAARWKSKQHWLANLVRAEAPHLRRHADVELRAPRRPGHGNDRPLGGPDPRERAALRSSASSRALPHHQPDERERDRRAQAASTPREEQPSTATRPSAGQDDHGRGARAQVRAGQPKAEAAGKQVRARAQEALHGAATSRSCSIRAGPMPGIASSSSSELKAPCFWR